MAEKRETKVLVGGETIYKNIYRKAYSRGMTIHELCDKAGLSYTLIYRLKSGESHGISIQTMIQLSRTLRCTVDELITEEVPENWNGDKPYPRIAPRPYYERLLEPIKENPDIRKLIKLAVTCSPKRLRAVTLLLEDMIDADNAQDDTEARATIVDGKKSTTNDSEKA